MYCNKIKILILPIHVTLLLLLTTRQCCITYSAVASLFSFSGQHCLAQHATNITKQQCYPVKDIAARLSWKRHTVIKTIR